MNLLSAQGGRLYKEEWYFVGMVTRYLEAAQSGPDAVKMLAEECESIIKVGLSLLMRFSRLP